MLDAASVPDGQARTFLQLYAPHRDMLRDFYEQLPEERYDFRLTDGPALRSDSPRESLAHVLETRLIYLNAVRSGTLNFAPPDIEPLRQASKTVLLAAWDRIEADMLAMFNSPHFDADKVVVCPWGDWTAAQTLYLIRDHEILHVGWNLALMDALGLPRFQSLREYWG